MHKLKTSDILVSESGKICTPLWTETSHQGWAQTLQSTHLHPQWLKVKPLPELPRRDLKKGSSARASDRSLCIISVHEHLSRADIQWNLTDYAQERLHEDSAGPTDLWVKALKLLSWLNSSHGHERQSMRWLMAFFLWFEDCSGNCLAQLLDPFQALPIFYDITAYFVASYKI